MNRWNEFHKMHPQWIERLKHLRDLFSMAMGNPRLWLFSIAKENPDVFVSTFKQRQLMLGWSTMLSEDANDADLNALAVDIFFETPDVAALFGFDSDR